MELRNDNFNIRNNSIGLRFTGKGLNDPPNISNIYTSNGIGFQLINNQLNNRELAIIDTSNFSSNNSPSLRILLNNSSVSLRNLDRNNLIQPIILNNNLTIATNIGIGSTIPQTPLDVAGRITCQDLNVGGTIINSNFISKVGTSASSITDGILKVVYGGTGTSSLNNERLLIGNGTSPIYQTPFLVWKDPVRRLGIGLTDPFYTLDVYGNINAQSYTINGVDINNVFLRQPDLDITSNICYSNSSNNSYRNSINYTDKVKNDVIDIFNNRINVWNTNGNEIVYIYSRIGIGTNFPLTSLDVVGDINYTGRLMRNGVPFKTFSGNYEDLSNKPAFVWQLNCNNIYNLNGGNVGIGSTIPRAKLDVFGDINYSGDLRSNGKIMNFFSGNYDDLSNKPKLADVALTGSFYDIKEVPPLFSGSYLDLTNVPQKFNADWNTNILNKPVYFQADWNTTVSNIPTRFNADWFSNILNKPEYFPTDWNSNIMNKPQYFPTDWNLSINNKPLTFNADWKSNVLNKPKFSRVAFTGEWSNILNKPYIFSGQYKELKNKPKYAEVCFTGNYYDLCNLPPIFSGRFYDLSNIPTFFNADWNSTIVNIPKFSPIAYSGSVKDLTDIPVENWGENGNNIYNCNVGNVGIGTSSPKFKLDIKGTFNIENSFKCDVSDILKKAWAIYYAEDWSGTTLPDSSGNGRDATTSGTITKSTASGNGLSAPITYIAGGTSSGITFPSGSVPSKFTLLSLTRRTSDKGTVLTISNGLNDQQAVQNFAHDFWGVGAGLIMYNNVFMTENSYYYSPYNNTSNKLKNWIRVIGRNTSAPPNNILFDGNSIGKNTNGGGNLNLCINILPSYIADYKSSWELGVVMIWDTELTDDEVFILDRCLKVAMSNGGSLKGYFRKIDIYNEVYFSNNVYLNNTNISNIFLSGTEFYKTSNWVINGTNVYNVNSGSIGINNTNPSSSYKLDVSGVINTNSNFNLSASSTTSVGIFWSSYGTTGIGCAGADSQYSTSSLSGDMIIRSQEGKRLILQNGSNAGALFIYSSNVGIGINSPSSFLHLHNSNNSGEVKILLTDASTGTSATNGFSIYKSGADDGYIWNYSNASMRFGTNNAEYMTILSNGNIGIGTTNPSSLFHLYNSNASGEVKLLFTDGSTGTTATSGFSIYKATNEEGFVWNYSNASIKFGTSNTERMVIQTSGNIGIGTTNPSSLIHLHNSNASGEVKLLFTDGSTGTSATSGFSIFKSGGDEGNIWNYSNASIRFGTSNTERMCVSSSGNIGIGTTNPSSLIHLHNSNSSGEVKLLFTDGSTGIGTTSGFSIFKSGSDDGNIWNYSNASIRFGTSNVERMSILSSGNIGIGTTNPSSLIHLHNSNASGEVKILLTDGSTGSNATSGFSIFKSGTDEGNIWNYSNASIRFGTSNTERMCLISSGNIGIGTTNPSSLIHLHNTNSLGEVKLLFTDGSTGTSASSGFAIFKSGGDDGYIWNYSNTSIRLGTSNAERMCVLSSGNIGFGTNNPSSLLHLHNTNASGEVKLLLTDGSTGIGATSGFSIYKSGDDNGYIWNYSNASIRFGTSNIERLCLSSSGNIGIGTTNPSSILHLHSGSSSTEVKILLTDNGTGSSSTSGFSIYKSTGNEGYIWNYSNASLRFGTNNTERLTILNNGNIGINNTSPSYLLDVNGTINATAFRGDGSLLSNLSLSGLSSSTVFTVSQGGTGASTFSAGRILFGNGTSAINTSSNLFWDNSSNKLGIGKTNPATALDVNGTITATSFIGSGSSITSLNATNITVGVLGVDRGGTGASTFSAGQVLFGNGTSAINSSANLYWNNSSSFLGIGKTNPASALDVNGTIIATNFSGNGSAITSLNVANITTGTLSVGRGGIGTTTLPAGRVLFGNDTSAINTNSNLFWDNTNSRLGIGKTNPATALDVNGTITATNFSGNGSAITSLNIANTSSGTLGVIRGGTGATTFPSGRILFGSDQSPINTTSNLLWDNTNSRLGIKNTAPAYTLDVTGDINFTGSIRKNGLVYTTNPAASQWTASGNNLYFSGSNVGIGLTNPTEKLHVNGTVKCDRLNISNILINSNTLQFNSGGTSNNAYIVFEGDPKPVLGGGTIIYPGSYIYYDAGVISFNVINSSSQLSKGVSFTGASYVGIGTTPEKNLPLKVASSGSNYSIIFSQSSAQSYLLSSTSSNLQALGGFYGLSGTYSNISASFAGSILLGQALIVYSDIRIKNNINEINSYDALNKILKIKPKKFKYTDFLENGHNDNYGFIAQDVKEIITEAVSYKKEFIPNIYNIFNINKDIIQTNEDLRDKLNINDDIQIIDINNKKQVVKILEITDTYIKIDKSLEDDKIFFYGKCVDDFHVLDKNIIFTLNVSATQELHKRLEIQEKRIQEQEELLKDRERRLKENEEKIEKLFQLLAMKQS